MFYVFLKVFILRLTVQCILWHKYRQKQRQTLLTDKKYRFMLFPAQFHRADSMHHQQNWLTVRRVEKPMTNAMPKEGPGTSILLDFCRI